MQKESSDIGGLVKNHKFGGFKPTDKPFTHWTGTRPIIPENHTTRACTTWQILRKRLVNPARTKKLNGARPTPNCISSTNPLRGTKWYHLPAVIQSDEEPID